MHCPFCNKEETRVIDSRLVGDGLQVRRRRECADCGERYTTYETAELLMPRIVKQDGSREPFNEAKLRNGISKALEKRPVSIEKIEASIDSIKQNLRSTGEREVQAKVLGKWVMEELRKLDEVSYVRFASVYHQFQDLNDFKDEVTRLENQAKDEAVF